MNDKYNYQKIFRSITPLAGYLKPRKVNRIIDNFIQELQLLEAPQKIEVNYTRQLLSSGKEIITEAEITSQDEIISGRIRADKRDLDTLTNGVIIELNFNSNEEAQKDRYLSLTEIVKKAK